MKKIADLKVLFVVSLILLQVFVLSSQAEERMPTIVWPRRLLAVPASGVITGKENALKPSQENKYPEELKKALEVEQSLRRAPPSRFNPIQN